MHVRVCVCSWCRYIFVTVDGYVVGVIFLLVFRKAMFHRDCGIVTSVYIYCLVSPSVLQPFVVHAF